jgi:hypothetical protein
MNQSILIHNSRLFWIRKYFLTVQTLAPVRQYALSGWRASSLSTQSRCAHSPRTKAHCVHTPSLKSQCARSSCTQTYCMYSLRAKSHRARSPSTQFHCGISPITVHCPNGVNYELIHMFGTISIDTDAWKHKKNVGPILTGVYLI